MIRAALLFGLLGAAGSAQAQGASVEWQVMLDGTPVGRASWKWDDTPGAESWNESLRLEVTQAGRRAHLGYEYELERVPRGEGFRFSRRLDLGEARQSDRGRIEAGRLYIEASSLSGARREIALPKGTILPFERVRRFSTVSAPGAVDWFDFDQLASETARLSPCAPAVAGASRCVRVESAEAGSSVWYFRANGEPSAVDFEFANLRLRLQPCKGACAEAQPVDLLSRLVVASPSRIAPQDSQRKLRFVLSRKDGRPPILALTGDQDFVFDANTAFVTVCRNCFPRPASTEAQLQAARRATPWLQSTHVRFRRMAARAGGEGEAVDARMRRSAAVLNEQLRPVRTLVGLADAVQTLEIGKADCIGFAVAFATLARAQGIPARIVIGMAYADRFSGRKDVFSPHAWVQAWDGKRWASYDAALGDFDSTHIAFAVGEDPAQLREAYSQLAELRLERVAAVREIE